MAQIVVAEVEAYDVGAATLRTLYFATQSYVTGAADTPANTFYDGRIKQPANVLRSCFASDRTFGKTQIGYGDMVLVNNDGALDGLLDYAFAGRSITIKLGVVNPNSNQIPTWVTVLKGTLEQAELSWQEIKFRVRDKQLDVAVPVQQARYAGTGAMEGSANLSGKPKPLIFGSVWSIAPPLVDQARFIYQVHSGSTINTIANVYDRGAELTAGAVYTSLADIQTNAPTAGTYRVWNDATGCYFRLAANPAGIVTCNATRGAAVANRTVGQLFSQILQQSGVAVGSINSADIAALDAVAGYDSGVFAGHEKDVTALQLLDDLCASVGAWYGCNALGEWRIGQIVAPTGAAVGTLTTTDIIKIERVSSKDTGAGVPAWKVKLGYQKLYKVLEDLTSAATAANKSLLSEAYRRVEASDATVKVAYTLSPEIEVLTQLVNQSDAQTECNRRLAIYKTRRDVYECTVRVDASLASILDIGKIVTLQVDRFGMSAGKKFLIIGVRTNMRGYQFDLTLWG